MVLLQPVSIGTLPLPMQELAIVEDLLFLMMVRVVGSVYQTIHVRSFFPLCNQSRVSPESTG